MSTIENYSNKQYNLNNLLLISRDNRNYRTLYNSSKHNKHNEEDEYILDDISLYDHRTLRSVSYRPRCNSYSLNNTTGSYFDNDDVYFTIYSNRMFPLTMAGGRRIKSVFDYETGCYKETVSFRDSALSLRSLKRMVDMMEINIDNVSDYPGIIWFKIERGPTYHE